MRRTMYIIILSVLSLAISGCSHIRIREPLVKSLTDWQTYAGSINRTNVSPVTITPPLDSAWEYNADAGFGAAPALVADSILFVANLRGEMYALESSTGRSTGRRDFKEAIIGTPVLDDDTLFVPFASSDEGIVAYDLRDGSTAWEASIGSVESAPLLIGGKLYAATIAGRLFCLDKNTGTIIWMFTVPADRMPVAIHSSPASDGRIIIFGCDDRKLYAVSADDGRLAWSVETKGFVSSPAIYSGKVYAGSADGSFYAVDIATGTLIWKTTIAGKTTSPAVNNDGIYVGTSSGEMYCLNRESGATVWQTVLNGPMRPAPLIAGTMIYAGCLDGTLHAVDCTSGKILWSYHTAGRIASSPVIAGDYLVIFKDNRRVVAFREASR